MRWCFLCHTEFPDGTRMVLARGGTNICEPCARTPRGISQTADPDRRFEGYRPAEDHGPRVRRAMRQIVTSRGGRGI